MSEIIEPEIENIRELDWSQAEAMIEARLELMEPEARLILRSIGAHERHDCFEALVGFFGTITLVEDEMTFESAIKVIDTVYSAFDNIDVDHDHVLTREELDVYTKQRIKKLDADKEVADSEVEKHSLTWLLDNYTHLQLANITRRSFGISKKDLLEAALVFRGLKHVQENFGEVSEIDHTGDRQITVKSLSRYFKKRKSRLSLHEITALKHLTAYITRIARQDLNHEGITKELLEHIGPEHFWGSAVDEASSESDLGLV